ncbi:hypothetical protein BKA58DRAFT_85756 [Alternaria rosae]|uniref:uncharacterized protein n=1 Tax=Alternaria rosae TaxID=1187941 RepID=UPI001E8CC235|nr:uncharacterized protein BKA58DRAFT_85756 [Alternaria rosae]KAH6877937.1 hypothetical protein BKA58DRAFT_85756 [Alternaria rosae]
MAPATKQTAKPNAKPVFKTSSPFSETQWPEITREDEEVILELLSNLITPLGDHRRTHIHPSKGKKRKRNTKTNEDGPDMLGNTPSSPEIGNHLVVGINHVTRHLEALAAKNAPTTVPVAYPKSTPEGTNENTATADHSKNSLRPLSMVILTHPKPSLSPAHAHFPTLVHLSALSPSSASTISEAATRFIPLQTTADTRLASSLHVPRVGAMGIYAGAPGAKTLELYVREHIGLTECKWVDEAMSAEWKGLHVKSEIPSSK